MFNRLRRQLCPDLAVDLGTANTVVAVAGAGVILDEPSVVALRDGTRQILGRGTAVGRLAKQMLGRTPDGVAAVRPLRSGVVTDFELCEAMLRYFVGKAGRRTLGLRPRLIVTVPGGVTPVERRAVLNAAERSGAGEVFLMDAGFAAGIGGGLPVTEPIASMVCSIGGGTTEVAVFSLGEIVARTSIRVGGDDMDEAITDHVRQSYSLKIGSQTAERLKIELGSALPLDEESTAEVGGLDAISNAPRKALVTSEDVRSALRPLLERIIRAARSVIERCPPELVADLADQGVLLTGGGSLLCRVDRYLTEELGIPCRIASSPQRAAAEGAMVCVEHFQDWRACLDNGGRSG